MITTTRTPSRLLAAVVGSLTRRALAACGGRRRHGDRHRRPTTPATDDHGDDRRADHRRPSRRRRPRRPGRRPPRVPPARCMPLTGLPITDRHMANRPALVVKIDNHPQARPQSGLERRRHRLRGERRAAHPLRRRVPERRRRPGRPDPLRPHAGHRPARVARPSRCSRGAAATPTSRRRSASVGPRRRQLDRRPATRRVRIRSTGREAPHNLYASTPRLFANFTPAFARAAAAAVHLPRRGRGVQRRGDRRRRPRDGRCRRSLGVGRRQPARYLRVQGGKPHHDDGGEPGQRRQRRRARGRLPAQPGRRAQPRGADASAPARSTCSPAA